MPPRASDSSSSDEPAGGPGEEQREPTKGHSVLVVAGAALEGEELRNEVKRHLADADAEIHVITPAFTETRFEHHSGSIDDALEAAKKRLDGSLEELRKLANKVSGAVGDSDPMLAIDDALAIFPADEILIVTHRDDEAAWLEDEAFERARDRFSQPIVHVVAEESAGEHHVADVEEVPEGHPTPDADDEWSWNLPPLTLRDALGIFVAIAGTGVLIVLAAICDDGATFQQHAGGFSGCDARLLIAIGAALVNLAHIVGLVLFESVNYKGMWEKFFARMSMFGTPTAIVVSLLIG